MQAKNPSPPLTLFPLSLSHTQSTGTTSEVLDTSRRDEILEIFISIHGSPEGKITRLDTLTLTQTHSHMNFLFFTLTFYVYAGSEGKALTYSLTLSTYLWLSVTWEDAFIPLQR